MGGLEPTKDGGLRRWLALAEHVFNAVGVVAFAAFVVVVVGVSLESIRQLLTGPLGPFFILGIIWIAWRWVHKEWV